MQYLVLCCSKKKHDVAQSNIVYAIWNKKKKDVGNYAWKAETRITSLSVKIEGGGVLQAAKSNNAKLYLSQNYNKKAISSFVFRQLYSIEHIC